MANLSYSSNIGKLQTSEFKKTCQISALGMNRNIFLSVLLDKKDLKTLFVNADFQYLHAALNALWLIHWNANDESKI